MSMFVETTPTPRRKATETLDADLRAMATEALIVNDGNFVRSLVTFRKMLLEDGRTGLIELALRPYLAIFVGQKGRVNPPAGKTAGGKGHSMSDAHSEDAQPVREPTASQKAAALEVDKQIAKSLLDTYKIHDGRSIGDVRFGELRKLWETDGQHAFTFRGIMRKYAHVAHDARVRDVVSADELGEIVQNATRTVDEF